MRRRSRLTDPEFPSFTPRVLPDMTGWPTWLVVAVGGVALALVAVRCNGRMDAARKLETLEAPTPADPERR